LRLAATPPPLTSVTPAQTEQRQEALEEVAAALPPAAPSAPEELCQRLLIEVRSALRGRTLAELCEWLGASAHGVKEACELLLARGQFVRRGQKFFVA
jgi:hypothetical protein